MSIIFVDKSLVKYENRGNSIMPLVVFGAAVVVGMLVAPVHAR